MGRGIQAALPAEVDGLRAKVERWRQQRKGLGPMPEKLWTEAAELAARSGINPICQAMGLSYTTLKMRMTPGAAPRQASSPESSAKAFSFVELRGESLLGGVQAGPVLEITSKDGVHLVLRFPAGSAVNLESLLASILGRR